jgi:hypothetical protein
MDSGNNGHRSEDVRPRVLIIVHGHEPAGWVDEACRAVSMWVRPIIRVLAIPEAPSPPFTSLTSFARRAFDAARSEWTKEEEVRVQGVIDHMIPLLPDCVEVTAVKVLKGSLITAIVEQVTAWSADVAVVAGPAAGIRSWLWPGPVLERLLHHANCAVLITAPPAPQTKPALNKGA